MWHGAPLDDFLEPSTTLRVQFLRHLGPIDLEKGHCTTFLGAADFFWVLVHGLSGTRRAQTFFPVHCEPKATPGKTHERHRRSPGPRTFSHFFNLILEGVYFYEPGFGDWPRHKIREILLEIRWCDSFWASRKMLIALGEIS